VIIDGLDPNWVTVMRYSEYACVTPEVAAAGLPAALQARVRQVQRALP
jgi:hypothetical protein